MVVVVAVLVLALLAAAAAAVVVTVHCVYSFIRHPDMKVSWFLSDVPSASSINGPSPKMMLTIMFKRWNQGDSK